MSQAIARLMEEHALILEVLDSLDGFNGEPAELGPYGRFFAEYVDLYHHEKEEQILFQAMHDAGLPIDMGPLGCMMYEHEAGRSLVRLMREAATECGWDNPRRAQVRAAIHEFIDLLRMHIQKENQALYPMAKAEIGDAMGDVDERCQRVDDGFTQRSALESVAQGLIGRRAPTDAGFAATGAAI